MEGTFIKNTSLVIILAAFSFAVVTAGGASAAVLRYVDDNAPNDPGPGDPTVSDPAEDGSTDHPFDTIQEAIDAASDGDTIIVRDGTYTGEGNRDIDFTGKAIHLRSENGPDNCIIDCQGTEAEPHRGFYFHSGENNDSILDGLTITGGYAYGGGGVLSSDASPTLTNCIIRDNTAAGLSGGGAAFNRSSPVIFNCTIARNSVTGEGGGMFLHDVSATIRNCIFWQNDARDDVDYVLAGSVSLDFDYCNLRQSVAPSWGTHNIDAEPIFADPDNGDYHLKSQGGRWDTAASASVGGWVTDAVTSPCIDAGDPASDYSSEPDPNGGRVNMGAYGNTAEASKTYIPPPPWYVDDDATPDPGPGDPTVSDPLEDGTLAHPFDAIQEAIDAASNDDMVIVRDGLYTGDGNRDIDFGGKAVHLRSENGPENCVIDAEGSETTPRRVFLFTSGESADAVLDGFTIGGGYALEGGGIYCHNNSSPTISNNIVTGNAAGRYGGGIYCHNNSSPTISNNTITDNTAGRYGGGIYCRDNSSPTISNNTITDNTAKRYGGGIYCCDNSSPTINNNTVTTNTAEWRGGGVYCLGSSPMIRNTILWSNDAPTGPQICLASPTQPSALAVRYSDVEGGAGAAHVDDGCTLDLDSSNIDTDPLFADPDNGDYHLKSQEGRWDPAAETWVVDDVTSPCIDGGNPAGDYANEPQPNGARINMGAYGNTAQASKTYVPPTMWYVDDDAPDDPGPGDPSVSDPAEDGTLAHPFDAIQETIDAASNGDMVIVRDGLYTGDGNRNIDFGGKAVHLWSENGPDNCVINCEGTYQNPRRGFYFHNGEDADSIVSGFTVTGGYATGSSFPGHDFGGAFYCDGASPTITDNVLVNNVASYNGWGGAISCTGSASPLISNNVIQGNSASYGGGISSTGSGTSPLIINNLIIGNLIIGYSARRYGAGIYCGDYSTTDILNNTIADNDASESTWSVPGAGICSRAGASANVRNCIIWRNISEDEDQISIRASGNDVAFLSVSHCDIAGGQAAIFVGTGGTLEWGEGNIDTDPLFADAERGNYRLVAASLCIDAGDPTYTPLPGEVDLAGNARVVGLAIDIGAYEYSPGLDYTQPAVDGGPDLVIQQDTYDPVEITLPGSATDNTDSELDFAWYEGYVLLGTASTLVHTFSTGMHFLTLKATDDSGNVGQDEVILRVSRVTYVDDNAPADPGPGDTSVSDPLEDGSEDHPYDAIQEAIDAALDADTVIVRDGLYTGPGNRDIWIQGKTVYLRSENGPDNCIIDAQGSELDPHRVFSITSGEDEHTVIDGLTISGGYATYNLNYEGAGIRCNDSAPTIINNVLTSNTAFYGSAIYAGRGSPFIDSNTVTRSYGVALYCTDGAPTISNNTIIGEPDSTGGGISCSTADATITDNIITGRQGLGISAGGESVITGNTVSDCQDTGISASGNVVINGNTITGNTAIDDGGGIYATNYSAATITGNIIANNEASGGGGGVYCRGGAPLIAENTITGNTADNGGGVLTSESAAVVTNNVIMNNIAQGTRSAGGGILSGSIPSTISNNIITGNTANSGGGIYCQTSLVAHNRIENNSAWSGGGITCRRDATITNNIIWRNTAYRSPPGWGTTGGGGGIACSSGAPQLVNNTITENEALRGGGISSSQASPSIINCIVRDNRAGVGAQIGAIGLTHPTDTITISYSNVQGAYQSTFLLWDVTLEWGQGNLDIDPAFAAPELGDFHLKSVEGRWDPTANAGAGAWVTDALQSSCIDAGTPGQDHATEPDPNGGRINIGAYGNTVEASKSYTGTTWTLRVESRSVDGQEPDPAAQGAVVTGACNGTTPFEVDVPQNSSVALCTWQAGELRLVRWESTDGQVIGAAAKLELIVDSDMTVVAVFDDVTDFYVNDEIPDAGIAAGSNDNPGTSPEYPAASVQAVLDRFSVTDGCTIHVAPGLYSENLFVGEGHSRLSLVGAGAESTVVDGTGRASCLFVLSGPEFSVSGFTFQNGRAFNVNGVRSEGGGICVINGGTTSASVSDNAVQHCEAESGGGIFCQVEGVLANNVIRNNRAAEHGGGIWGGTIITGNTVSDNEADWRGGGIWCRGAEVEGNVVTGNAAGIWGGGIVARDDTLLQQNIIAGNTAQTTGGGLLTFGYTVQASNNTFIGNRAGEAGGAVHIGTFNSQVTITNSILWGNVAPVGHEFSVNELAELTVLYSNVEGGAQEVHVEADAELLWDTSNMAGESLFADPGHWDGNGTPDDTTDDVWINGDYHLKSKYGRWDPAAETWVVDDVTSPCIDTGDPESEYSNEPQPNGARINMGAYGNTAEASKTYLSAAPPPWYVDDNALNDPGPGDPSVSDPAEDGSPDHPFDSIQEAIDIAFDGVAIIVRDGLYTGDGNRDIDFLGKAIHLRSENGPDNCVIDAEGSEAEHHRGFVFQSGANNDSILDGLTITGGYAYLGGGVAGRDASPTLMNCIITDNTSTGAGGGITFIESSPVILNCTIARNSATGEGGGMFLAHVSATIRNCIFWQNDAYDDDDFVLAGAISLDFDYCNLRQTVDPSWGTHNFDTDPLFADPDSGDYHLKSEYGRWDPAAET